MVTEHLWRIEAPHYCAGLVVRDGLVIRAAPILRWSTGRPWHEVRGYLAGKGFHGKVLESER